MRGSVHSVEGEPEFQGMKVGLERMGDLSVLWVFKVIVRSFGSVGCGK